jgi:AraC family transcriptional regulator of adaptative response / DNA-3-methyladenine glycosylase II
METPDLFTRRGSLEETIARLRSLRGVGDWTAHYIAMRQIRETDAFPAADIGLMRAMTGRDGRRPTAPELLARAERWRPWRAYAAQHLWSGTPPVDGLRRGSTGGYPYEAPG